MIEAAVALFLIWFLLGAAVKWTTKGFLLLLCVGSEEDRRAYFGRKGRGAR